MTATRTMHRLRAAGWAALLAAGITSAAAQDLVPYRVQPGDTLYDIAERLLRSADDWPVLARINRIAEPDLLIPGSTVLLPIDRLRGEPLRVTVAYARGQVEATDKHGQRRTLAIGDRLTEGEIVQVAAQSYATLRFDDGSMLQLDAGSRVRLLRVRELPQAERDQAVIELQQGRVESDVAPKRTGSRFDVRTPLAVAGVRGTHFGVALSADAGTMTTDVERGVVAVQAGAAGAELGAGEGALVGRTRAGVERRPLLPAPDLAGLPERVEDAAAAIAPAPVEGAAGYRVRIAEDQAFVRVVRAQEFAPGAAAGFGALADGHYFVGLRALDHEGLAGAEAVRAVYLKTTPQAPLVQAPAPGQVLARGNVELVCTDVPGAAGYRLQVAAPGQAGFADLPGATTRAHCRFDFEARADGEYRWRVATLARDAQGGVERGPYSAPASFRAATQPAPPEPRSEARAGGVAVFWEGVPGARYLVQVATDEGFAAPVRTLEVAEPAASFDLAPLCTPYYVRLQTIAADTLRSEFSTPRRLQTPTPLCDSLGRPVGGAGGVPWLRDAR